MHLKVGGVVVCLTLLLCSASSQLLSNLTVGGSAGFVDLATVNRPPPFVQACVDSASVTTNHAAGAKVTLVNTASGTASQAVDGSSNTCVKTRSGSNPWLLIDLGQPRLIGRVTISFPSGDYTGLEVRVGDSAAAGGASNPVCYKFTTKPQQITSAWCNIPLNGRYVTLRIAGNGKTVGVCEATAFSTCESVHGNCPNLALKQPTRQSTTGWGGNSGRAVDGNGNRYYGGGSCTHTLGQSNPWWYVDLGATQPVRKIQLTNRIDCCWTRLNGVEIRVGDDNTSGGTKNAKCVAKAIPNFGRGEIRTITCDKVLHGRYVFVRIPGGGKVLTLCEVRVYSDCSPTPQLCTDSGCARGPDSNVALNRPAAQSSNYNNVFVASKATDGTVSSHINYCTHTKTQANPWWRVDLGCVRTVAKVSVVNRGDCCADRLNGFQVAVGNDPANGGVNNPICAAPKTGLGAGWNIFVTCPNLLGRYVTVFLKGNNKILSICEVQVFEYCDQECYNLALNQPATSSSVANTYTTPALAVDGNTNTHYYGLSCFVSNYNANPWFTVDLGTFREVGKVRIYNRGDCSWCSNGLGNFEVRVGWSSGANGVNNPLCYTGSAKYSIPKWQAVDVMCDANRQGRYVTVREISSRDRLSLCEIEVYEKGACHEYGCYNHAQGRPATISSLYSSRWPASKAVDGDYWSKNINSNKCTHSKTQTNPWFRVELWQEIIIEKVYIANRGDCCGDRLTNFEIRVGNSLVNSGNSNPVCRQNLPTMSNGQYKYYACPDLMGRYVNLLIRKTGAVLNFCELQVCGRLPANAAHGKPTFQSSSAHGGVPSRAVDGNPANAYNVGSCTHTNAEKNPWWRVDLMEEKTVTSIRITNRGDCCWDRLYGFELRVGNSLDFEGNNNPKCIASTPNIARGQTWTIMCGSNGVGVNGRYVNILIPGDGKVLTVCEVQVFAKPIRQCKKSGRWSQNCGGYCSGGTGGIGCHTCPAGKVGRIRHLDSGLCAVPDRNLTYPYNSLRPVMSSKCDSLNSLFLHSESGLFYHIASGYCLHIDQGGFNPKDGQELVFWYGCQAWDSRLQFLMSTEGHLQNQRTKECVRVKNFNPTEGDRLAMYKDCTHAAIDYAFIIDEEASKRWSVAINIVSNDPRFNYLSDTWFNPKYFGSADDLSKNAFLPAYDKVLVESLSIQLNNVEHLVALPPDLAGKWTLKDLVLRDGSLSISPTLKSKLDAFNFQTVTPPVGYCSNHGFNFQLKDQQKWLSCQSYARIGAPLDDALKTGIFKLGQGSSCIHVSGGGFNAPADNTNLVAWGGCTEDRLRFTYRADKTFQHPTGKCIGLKDAKPVKGTQVVIKSCNNAAKFTWRSDGVILYSTNPLLCWAVEGIPTGSPANGKKIILSDVCDPKKNAIYIFKFLSAGYDTACQKPSSVEGVGLFHGCNMKSSASGRLLNGQVVFKPAVVRVYGRPACSENADGCSPQMGYCSCKNGYFGASCEYKCPDGRFGKSCRQTCRCQNNGLCDFRDGSCACPCGYYGNLCQNPCAKNTWGPGCLLQCNCTANAAGCDPCTGKCICNAGFGGSRCDKPCGVGAYKGMWGSNCANKCPCVNGGMCDSKTGVCTCKPGYQGVLCEQTCPQGVYGLNCASVCNCAHGSSCNHTTGICNCVAGFSGGQCSEPCKGDRCGQGCLQTCGCVNGACDGVKCSCKCDPGWTGPKCDKLCPSGKYGQDCSQSCQCHSQAKCDHKDGSCTCPPGRTGALCDQTCAPAYYGQDCAKPCACKNNAQCDSVTGHCTCAVGYTGADCGQVCRPGYFGDRCNETCKCGAHVTPEKCNHASGACVCLTGWHGVMCNNQCPDGFWGNSCSQKCSCQNGASCDPNDGSCVCKPGYIGSDCSQTCATGKYGVNCGYTCTCVALNSQCDPIDGTCSCKPGWQGHDCDQRCAEGSYGAGCGQRCSCVNGRCDPVTGTCSCDRGWTGVNCDANCGNNTYGLLCSGTCKCDPTAMCNPVDGTCTCAPGMQGLYCDHQCHGFFGYGCLAKCPPCVTTNVKVPLDCHPATGACQCLPGFTGVLCADACPLGTYGQDCKQQCKCQNGDCNPIDGSCTCFSGATGDLCEITCPAGFFGENCQFKCACKHAKQVCDGITGECSCSPGWQPPMCVSACPSGTYGQDCKQSCTCQNGDCDPVAGVCTCIPGFQGDDCGAPCNSTTWGPNCLYNCNECENYQACEPTSGNCTCGPGFTGEECATPCPLGYHGYNCESLCQCKNLGTCDPITGGCNCTIGFWGATCENIGCPNGTYGELCALKCDCLPEQLCSFIDGTCYYPQSYYDAQSELSDDSSKLSTSEIGIIVGCIVGGLVLIVAVVLVFLYCKGSDNRKTPAAVFTNEGDVTFGGPEDFGSVKEDSGNDGFTNPMYATGTLKNEIYDDPVKENPAYGSQDNIADYDNA